MEEVMQLKLNIITGSFKGNIIYGEIYDLSNTNDLKNLKEYCENHKHIKGFKIIEYCKNIDNPKTLIEYIFGENNYGSFAFENNIYLKKEYHVIVNSPITCSREILFLMNLIDPNSIDRTVDCLNRIFDNYHSNVKIKNKKIKYN